MSVNRFNQRIKNFIAVTIVVSLVFSLGCGLWPFGKKDAAEEALRLKNRANQKYSLIKNHAEQFDNFLLELHKRWYTTKDVQRFANTFSTFKTQIKQDQAGLQQVYVDLSQLAELDRDQKYEKFIKEMGNSSEALDKALVSSQKIVAVLSPKISNIAKLYQTIDEAKEAQSGYSAALIADTGREQQASASKALLQSLLAPPAPAPSTDTTTDTTTTTDQSGSTTPTSQPIQTNETTTDTGTTDTTGDTTSDIPPWVYQILGDTWPSSYVRDYIQDSSERFNDIYQNVYLLHKEVGFENSRKLVSYLQQVKADNADFASSMNALIENIREQKRLEKQIESVKSTLSALEASKNSYAYLEKNRPAGVSGGSVASKGMSYGRQVSDVEINRYKEMQSDLQSRLDILKQAYEGSLTTDHNEARWRFRGSLIALYQLNTSISRSLMHETKRWKSNAIAKFVYHRLEYLAEAKHHNYKANQAYREAADKIASK